VRSPNYLDKPGVSHAARMSNQRKLWAKWPMHDIHTYGGSTLGGEQMLYFWLDHAFDLTGADVKFHPYWDSEPAVQATKGSWAVEGKELDLASKYLATAYSQSGGQALVIVVRDAPNNYDGAVTLDGTELERVRQILEHADQFLEGPLARRSNGPQRRGGQPNRPGGAKGEEVAPRQLEMLLRQTIG